MLGELMLSASIVGETVTVCFYLYLFKFVRIWYISPHISNYFQLLTVKTVLDKTTLCKVLLYLQ